MDLVLFDLYTLICSFVFNLLESFCFQSASSTESIVKEFLKSVSKAYYINWYADVLGVMSVMFFL